MPAHRSITVALVLAAAAVTTRAIATAAEDSRPGVDFLPLRAAANALWSGQSIYRDPTFVYPPTASLLLSPLRLGSAAATSSWWLVGAVLAVVAAGVIIARQAEPGLRVRAGCLAVLALVGSNVFSLSLGVGNLSVYLTPFAVGTVVAFRRERWTLGTGLLVASLLIKPLLLPLMLVPVVRRQWWSLLVTTVPALLVLLAAVVVVPGGRDYPKVFAYCLRGTNLHGRNAGNGLSLREVLEAHHVPSAIGFVAAGAVMIISGLVARARARSSLPVTTVATAAFSTVLLAGSLAEIHYLLAGLALVLLDLVALPSRRRLLAYGPGLLMLTVLAPGLAPELAAAVGYQTWYVAAELLLWAGSLYALQPAGDAGVCDAPQSTTNAVPGIQRRRQLWRTPSRSTAAVCGARAPTSPRRATT